MARAKHLIENTDPDSPESFGVAKHLDSPVARIAATSGFKLSRVSNEERWVKELSNGKEVWLRTISSREYELPMDFQKGRGGREWELVEYTKVNGRYTNPKLLIRTNEVAMSYVLGAHLQRLATWPADMPKPTLEGVDDPDVVLQNFEPRFLVVSKVGPFQPKQTYWGGKGQPDHVTGRGFWHNSPLDAATFTREEAEQEVEYLVQNYIKTAGRDRAYGESRVGMELMSPALMDKWRKQRARNAARRKKPVIEDVPVPDPDDPATAVSSFVQSKTPYYPDYAKLARYIDDNRENVYISGRLTRHGRYVHENSTSFELIIESNDLPDEIAVLANTVEKQIGEEIVRINKKIYRALEREWDYLNSDEHIDEWLEEQADDRYNALGNAYDDDDEAEGEEAYTFQQLDDAGKERARDNYRTSGLDYDWWDHIYEEWHEELREMGFSNPEISFSGFASQGDGASFTANGFDFLKWANWFMSSKPVERGHPYTDDLPVTESVDEPSKEQLIHMGRAGKCDQHCQHCGAYCTLIHYDLNGTQMPQYHICQTCDSPLTEIGLNNDKHVIESSYNFPDQGEQDKPEHWADDPEPDVDDPTSVLKQEVAKRSEPIKKLHIYGRRWYRRGAGGVYCKAYIYINDKLVHVTPEQYGYNDHYLTLATDWLRREGYLEGLLAPNEPIWYLRDKKIVPDLMYYVTDVKRERDL